MNSDKKEYRTALEILNGLCSPSQFYEKLNRLFARSEDQQFRKLIAPVLGALRDAHVILASKKMSTRKGPVNYGIEPYAALVKYCRQQLVNEKPTWQILAEQHGWRPAGKV